MNRYRQGLSSFNALTWHDCDASLFADMGAYLLGQKVAHLREFTMYLGVSPVKEGLIVLHDKNEYVAASNVAPSGTQFTALLGDRWQQDLNDYAVAVLNEE